MSGGPADAFRPRPPSTRLRPWEVPLYGGLATVFFSHFTDWSGHEVVCSTMGRNPSAWFVGHLALSVGAIAYGFFFAPERSSRWTSLVLAGWAALGLLAAQVQHRPPSTGPWIAALGWTALLLCAVWTLFIPRMNESVRIEGDPPDPTARGTNDPRDGTR